MDTSEEAWRHMQNLLRKMTPAQKIERVLELSEAVQTMALSELRRLYPNDDERRLQMRLLARTVDGSTMKAAYGWPDERAILDDAAVATR